MPNTTIRPIAALVAGAAATVLACAEPTGLVRQPAAPSLGLSSGVELLECPLPVASVGMGTVGPSGGTVVAGSSSISIPAGALLAPTQITVVESASDFVEVEITAGNAEHFQFESPVTIAIGYSRCGSVSGGPLDAWYIDGETNAPLEEMDATDDRQAKVVRFETDHLSSYAVAH